MNVTPELVAEQYDWTIERAPAIVALVNRTREQLGGEFSVDVDPIEEAQYRGVIDETFADGERAVNVAAMIAILRDLDVPDDYPGFVVDELLGRELAATLAGNQPLRLLAEATFHYADVHTHEAESGDTDRVSAGADDLDAALAAGVQTRLPGWPWREIETEFAVGR